MDVKAVVGNVATVVTLGSFLSGAVVCKTFVKKGSTGDIASIPFIAGALCSILWLRYGLYISDSSLIYVNSTGLFLNLCYIICYYVYATSKSSCQKQLFVVGGFLSALMIYLTLMTSDVGSAMYISGMTACASSLFACASPLFSLGEVFRTKSAASLPFPIISSMFVVTSLWFFYGLLLEDNFIKVPNALGSLLSAFQLFLFVIYPSKAGKSKSK